MRVPLKTFFLLIWIGLCAAALGAARLSRRRRLEEAVIRRCYAGLMRIIGVRCAVRGAPAQQRPLLLVTNHSSYLDVIVLGAMARVRFTPKAEIAGWPLIGGICRLTRCVFIDRKPHRTAANRAALHAALAEGAIISLFPEGTTGDGKRVLPFRSSYFSLAEERFGGAPLTVQPATVRYTHISGLPIDSTQRPKIAWYGDMDLLPHAAELLRLGPIRAELEWHPPVDISRFADRKALAAHCEKSIQYIDN